MELDRTEEEGGGGGDFEICPDSPDPFVKVTEDGFGLFTNEDGSKEIVKRYTFINQNSLIVQVISYGAAITCIKYPDKNGVLEDVALGFDDMEGYLSPRNPQFGAIIGRCANRIAKGHFKIGNKDYQLSTNAGEHHFNGGFRGFDKVNWKSDLQDNKVVLTYLSKDGEEGYPGEVLTSVSYEMTTDNDFIIDMKATTSKTTPINLTNNTFFNLAGHGTGSKTLYQHFIAINADCYCHTDEEFIPTGMLRNVVNTLWDLRIARKLGSCIGHVPYGGYDQTFCIHKTSSECMTFIARAVHEESGRCLEVYSNQPGVHFYTANQFPSKFIGRQDVAVKVDVKGKQGVHYYKHQAFCLDSQNYPDAVNNFVFRGFEVETAPNRCLVTKCPHCGYLIRDPDFENASDEETHSVEEKKKETSEEEPLIMIGKDGLRYFRHAGFSFMTQKYPDSVHRKNFPNCIIKPGEMYCHKIRYKFELFEKAPSQVPDEEEMPPEPESAEGEVEQEEDEDKYKKADDLIDPKLEENGR